MQTLNNYEFLILIYNAYNASSLKLMNSGRYVILEGAIKENDDFEETLFADIELRECTIEVT